MKQVLVIGGGFSGLAAAKTLVTQAGEEVKVTVLEGGSRVGGRANTQHLADLGRVEFGATYLHGMKGHFLYQIAKDAGLLGPVHTKELCWGFVQPGENGWVPQVSFQKIQQAVQAYAAARDCDDEPMLATLGDRLSKAAKQEMETLNPKEKELFLKAWRWHEVQMMVNTSSPSSADVSCAWWEVCDDLEGPNFPIPAGFQAVAEYIAEGLDICYNVVVDRIEYGGEAGVAVHAADGRWFHADAVIVTVSLGVLKAEYKQMFHPPLPKRKQAAIEDLGWGYNDKIFLDFGSPPCSSAPLTEQPTIAYNLLWNIAWPGPRRDEVLQKHHKTEIPAWVAGIFSFRFGGSEFKPATVPRTSLYEVDAFGSKYCSSTGRFFGNSSIEMAHLAANAQPSDPAEVPLPEDHPRAACLWVSGWHAEALANASDEEVSSGISAVLQHFPAIPFTNCKRVWRSTWTQDPLFRGAYSYVSAKSSPADNEALAEPILGPSGKPLVMFAGEATTATNTSSTHGAFKTGRREAFRLLDSLGTVSANGHLNGM